MLGSDRGGILKGLLIAVGALFALSIVISLLAPAEERGGEQSDRAAPTPRAADVKRSTAPPPAPALPEVGAVELLNLYAANELAGDAEYKGKEIRITGVVGRIGNDILGTPYVTLGSGGELEVRQVQCMLDKASASIAARLTPGQTITMRGKVDGLMMNVIVRSCSFQ